MKYLKEVMVMALRQLAYPMILHPETEGGYSVEVPDINGGSWTQGETVAEAIVMGEDLIRTALLGETRYPVGTPVDEVECGEGDLVVMGKVNVAGLR
jgi:predicted RNase H-like HicB family nuclease